MKEWLSLALKGVFHVLQNDKSKENQESLMNLCRTCVLLDKMTIVSGIFRDTILDSFVSKLLQSEFKDSKDSKDSKEFQSLSPLYSSFLHFIKVDCDLIIQLTRSSYQTCSMNILTEAIWPSLIDGILQYVISIFNPGLTRAFHSVFLLKKSLKF